MNRKRTGGKTLDQKPKTSGGRFRAKFDRQMSEIIGEMAVSVLTTGTAGSSPEDDAKKYEDHMKYSPTHEYRAEFVFETHRSHKSGVVYLTGLPDIAESRPHSRVNW